MFGFLIAVTAGAATPMIEGPLARPLAGMLNSVIDLQEAEVRLLAFMVALLIAAVLSAVFATGSALGLIIGGALGYFGSRLMRWAQAMFEQRRG